jgi:hypothetical protein
MSCVFCGQNSHNNLQFQIRQKAKNEAKRRNKVKPEKQEYHVIDIDVMSDEFNYFDELPVNPSLL